MAEKMILPTPPAIREKLEKAGWYRSDALTGEERWFKSRDDNTRVYGDKSASGNIATIVEFAAILGILIPGYRIVPDDMVREMARRMLTLAEWFEKCYEGLSTGDEVQTDLRKWAGALSRKETSCE